MNAKARACAVLLALTCDTVPLDARDMQVRQLSSPSVIGRQVIGACAQAHVLQQLPPALPALHFRHDGLRLARLSPEDPARWLDHHRRHPRPRLRER